MKNKGFKKAAAIISAALLLSITACGSKEDPLATLEAALTKNAQTNDMDMDMDMDMELLQDGVSIGINSEGNMQMSGSSTTDMLYVADMDVEMDMDGQSQSVDTVTFYQDGYCYMETMGTKIKYVMDLNTMMETINQNTGLANIDTSYLTDLTLKKEGNEKIITFNTDPSKMNEYVAQAMGAVSGLMDSNNMEMTVKKMNGSYSINQDGYCTGTDIYMEMDMVVSGISCSVTADIDITYNNPGQPVNVSIPSTEGYTEVDISAIQ